MNIVNTLKLINLNTRFNKNTNINDVKRELLLLGDLLKLKTHAIHQGATEAEQFTLNLIYDITNNNVNYCLFLYIDNYNHLSNDKMKLREIKNVSLKIMYKYMRYFNSYNKINSPLNSS